MDLRRIAVLVLLYTGLTLLIMNLASMMIIYSSNDTEYVSVKSCYDYISTNLGKSVNISIERLGVSYTGSGNVSIVDEWIRMNTSNGVSVIINVLHTTDVKNITTSVILIHDIGQKRSSLYNLARFIVSKKYIVFIPDLSNFMNNVLDNFSRNNLVRILSIINGLSYLAINKYNTSKIIILGIGFGGTLAYLSNLFLDNIADSISIGFIGNIPYSIRHGGFVNYLIRDNIFDQCIDPLNYYPKSEKYYFIVIGSNDEYTPFKGLSDLFYRSNVFIVIEANRGYRNILPEWRNKISSLLEVVNNANLTKSSLFSSSDPVFFRVKIDSNNSVVLWRIGIPGFPWIVSPTGRVFIHSLYIIPSEYIIAENINGNYVVLRYYYHVPITGLVLSVILLLSALFLGKEFVDGIGNYSLLDLIFYTLLFLNLAVPFIPAIYAIDRFNLSILEYTDRISSFIPLIPSLAVISLFIQPLLLSLILVYNSKNSYYLYLSYPLFLIIVYYTLVLFMGSRYDNIYTCIPSIAVVIPLSIIILDALFTHEEHEEKPGSNATMDHHNSDRPSTTSPGQ